MRRPHIEAALRAADRLVHLPNPYDHIRELAAEVFRQREVMRAHGISDADAADGDGLRPHLHPFPGNVLQHVENMSEGDSDDDTPKQARAEVRTDVTDFDHAMVVTSAQGATRPWHFDPPGVPLHRPVIDIDHAAKLLPSSTPGHYHLMIDRPMTWANYQRLLDVMAEVGLVEPGYARVAHERGHTAVRVPWFRKGTPAPKLPAAVEPAPAVELDSLLDDLDPEPVAYAPAVATGPVPWPSVGASRPWGDR